MHKIKETDEILKAASFLISFSYLILSNSFYYFCELFTIEMAKIAVTYSLTNYAWNITHYAKTVMVLLHPYHPPSHFYHPVITQYYINEKIYLLSFCIQKNKLSSV